MKMFLVLFSFCLLQSPYSQVSSVKKYYKINRNYAKTPDSFKVGLSGAFISKVDTLYIRTLNQEKKNDNDWKDWLVPLISTLLGGIITLVAQYFLKKQERNLNSQNLKEKKRIRNLEHIHSVMNKLSLYDRNDTPLLLAEVNNLEKFVNDNHLYIERYYVKIIQSLTDYYKSVANDFKNKDYSIEIKYMDQFRNLFDR